MLRVDSSRLGVVIKRTVPNTSRRHLDRSRRSNSSNKHNIPDFFLLLRNHKQLPKTDTKKMEDIMAAFDIKDLTIPQVGGTQAVKGRDGNVPDPHVSSGSTEPVIPALDGVGPSQMASFMSADLPTSEASSHDWYQQGMGPNGEHNFSQAHPWFSKNTTRKTISDVNVFKRFCSAPPFNEPRPPEEIPPSELCPLLISYFTSCKKNNGQNYEPESLNSMLRSMERYLKASGYAHSVIQSEEFRELRLSIKRRKDELKELSHVKNSTENVSKKNFPTEEEEMILYSKGVIGLTNPFSLLCAVWMNNSKHFRIKSRETTVGLRWGDIQLKKLANGTEYLEYASLTTENAVARKAWAVGQGNLSCPVLVYKQYALHRPAAMMHADAPFYLGYWRKMPSSKVWYRDQGLGKDSILRMKTLLKEQAQDMNLPVPAWLQVLINPDGTSDTTSDMTPDRTPALPGGPDTAPTTPSTTRLSSPPTMLPTPTTMLSNPPTMLSNPPTILSSPPTMLSNPVMLPAPPSLLPPCTSTPLPASSFSEPPAMFQTAARRVHVRSPDPAEPPRKAPCLTLTVRRTNRTGTTSVLPAPLLYEVPVHNSSTRDHSTSLPTNQSVNQCANQVANQPTNQNPSQVELHEKLQVLQEEKVQLQQSVLVLERDKAVLQAKLAQMKLALREMEMQPAGESNISDATQTFMLEMQKNLISQFQENIIRLQRDFLEEKRKAVEETKRKQWCIQCGKEARLYCCWNTSYCDFSCQQAHWPVHMSTCHQQTNQHRPPAAPQPMDEERSLVPRSLEKTLVPRPFLQQPVIIPAKAEPDSSSQLTGPGGPGGTVTRLGQVTASRGPPRCVDMQEGEEGGGNSGSPSLMHQSGSTERRKNDHTYSQK
ncbi:ZMYND8 [Branchiostoma lanceolatum]|uniref:ZMYND8 protein n=1 Tax=Branchiostoma lanceolatum TaxID=7740 RepID=A0A8K0A2W4_BRALA|nr:ZMYND8 [Branchiostoma lanceolatum]